MKITKHQLKKIIKEELQRALKERSEFDPSRAPKYEKSRIEKKAAAGKYAKTGVTSNPRVNRMLEMPYDLGREQRIVQYLTKGKCDPKKGMLACQEIPDFVKTKYLSKPGGPMATLDMTEIEKRLSQDYYSKRDEYAIVKMMGCRPAKHPTDIEKGELYKACPQIPKWVVEKHLAKPDRVSDRRTPTSSLEDFIRDKLK